jgi:hypothetical protein
LIVSAVGGVGSPISMPSGLRGSSVAFYVSWTPKDAGLTIIRYPDAGSALDFACDLLAHTAVEIELGSIAEGQLTPKLSGDELRIACERRGGLSRGHT